MVRTIRACMTAAIVALAGPAFAQPIPPPKDQPDVCLARERVDDVVPKVEFRDPAMRGMSTSSNPYIAGTTTEIERWPGFVSLRFVAPAGKKFEDWGKRADILYWCGGILIARDWVLTAAHCVFDGQSAPDGHLVTYDTTAGAWLATERMEDYGLPKGSRLEILESTDDLTKITAAPLRPLRAADAVIVHPGYFKPRRYENDVALIRLDPSTPAKGYLAKISARFSVDPDAIKGRAVLGAGFGLTDLADPIRRSTDSSERVDAASAEFATFQGRDGRTGFAGTPFLQESLMRKVDDAGCRDHILRQANGAGPWRNSQICAQGIAQSDRPQRRNAPDSCNSDSGGPLMQLDAKGCPIVSGLVSFGPQVCGGVNAPGIYTRISSYYPWIKSKTGNARLLAVTDPREIPPAGAIYSLLASDADISAGASLGVKRLLEQAEERIGDVVPIDIATGATGGYLTVLQRDALGKLAFLQPRRLFAGIQIDAGPRTVEPNSVTPLPDETRGFEVTPPAGPRSIFAFVAPTPALHEALKLEMRSRPRRLTATPAIRDEILRRLRAYPGLAIGQTRYSVVAP